MSDSGETWFNDDSGTWGERDKALLEQYKLYVDSANKISDRRGTANSFLLTASSALVTVYGLMAKGDPGTASLGDAWTWLIPVAGILVCVAWFALIRAYRSLNTAKFTVIHELERRLPARLFDLEWHYLERGKTWLYTPLSHVEQFVPMVFAAIYAGLLVATLAQ